ncbi:unnamed protein product [Dovyalis caffra]|uniref:Uncharacterized protein n=1 Tax=Dovyalis caffra TaxID=77055 RepID=A0AAV1SRF2_9ROSI|nr:unnamed protein product [Dovyalis caffra]
MEIIFRIVEGGDFYHSASPLDIVDEENNYSIMHNITYSFHNMKKLLDFGRKALFYVRVLSGYEERKIRNHRLQLEQRLQQAQERKAALRKIPEQFVLAEVRRMVEEMQNLNKKIDEIEASFEDHFNPIDKKAEIIMKTQLEGEESSMKEMTKAMQAQALLEAEKIANVNDADTNLSNQETESTTKQHAQMR